jgi:cell division protein FtsL
LLGIALAPLQLLGRRVAASPRMRRLGIRLLVLTVVLVFLASSVGVILINNVVIGRTAELGKLDTSRRELRRDNALLGAESAKLSSQSVVQKRARQDLGMVPTPELPQFIYLDPASHALTPFQLQRRAAIANGTRARTAAATASAASATPPADTTKTKEP